MQDLEENRKPIYSVKREHLDAILPKYILEDKEVMDFQNNTWRLRRGEDFITIAYEGDPKKNYQTVTVKVGDKDDLIVNTGSFVMKQTTIDDFLEINNVVMFGKTDEVWGHIFYLIEERINKEDKIMNVESVINN